MHHFSPYKMFKKTAESDNMIINLPEAMVLHPKHLHYYQPMDTVYPNNFTTTASDYHFYYNMWRNYEYKLTAGLTLNDENAGNMDVSSSSRSFRSYAYASGFDFPDGYNISAMWQYGDTATSSFSLTKDNDTLFKESSIFITRDFHRREKQYELTIGDVQIKKSDVDSIQVFVAGVLQQHAAKIITSESDTAASVCHKRDILLTYDDGTTAKLSELISPVKSQLGLLSDSLRSMYFARHIVDYIAISIYYDTHQYYY